MTKDTGSEGAGVRRNEVTSNWDNMKAWLMTRMEADNARTSAWQETLERMDALEREEEYGRDEALSNLTRETKENE